MCNIIEKSKEYGQLYREIKEFLKDNIIDTQRAISYPEISIEYIEDGDLWYEIRIELFSMNVSATRSTLKLCLKALNTFTSSVYAASGEMVIHIYESICDPD